MKKKFNVYGMTCSACVNHVSKAVNKIDGVSEVNVSLLTNTLVMECNENISDEIIINAIKNAGYNASKYVEMKYEVKTNSKRIKLISSLIFLVLLLYFSMGSMINISFIKDKLILTIVEIILLIPIVILNFNYFTSGYSKLLKLKPNMDSLVALGASASIIYSIYVTIMIFISYFNKNNIAIDNYFHELYYEGAATILTLVSVGKYIESNSKSKTSKALEELSNLKGKQVIRINNDIEELIDVENIRKDDVLKINTGSNIPVDGIIIKGNGFINESTMTGESIPLYKKKDDKVISGTTLVDGTIYYKALNTTANSTLANIVNMVEEASASKAPIARVADKVSGIFIPVVLFISLIVFIIWSIISNDIYLSLKYAISVLVISCPCALGLATPICIMIATGIAAKNHILIKDGKTLEELCHINVAVFDKTGTITEGKLKVKEYYKNEENFLNLLVSLEKNSNHPLAKSIVEAFKDVDVYFTSNIKNIAGRGLIGQIEGVEYYVGNNEFINEFTNNKISINTNGNSIVILATKDNVIGHVLIDDNIKITSKYALFLFKKAGIKTIMLTGDNLDNAKKVKKLVKVDEIIANVLPENKANVIKKLQENNKVLMIGDGINDSIALNQANVSMSVKDASDIAIDSASIILMKNDLIDAYNAYKLSKKTLSIIKMNLFFAFIYNIIAIPIACGVLASLGISLNPMIASLCMSMSSICVCLNASRLYNFKKEKYVYMKQIIKVDGMMCKNCKKHVEEAIKAISNVVSVEANLETKEVTIEYDDSLDLDAIYNAVIEEGYSIIK